MDGSLPRYDLDHGLGIAEPADIFMRDLPLVNPECGSEAPAASRHGGHDLKMFSTGVAEQDAFGRRGDRSTQAIERNRLVVNHDLADFDETIDEVSQAEFVEGRAGRWCYGFEQ